MRRAIGEALRGFRRDLNVIQARGVWRIFAVALRQYQRSSKSRALLDFSGVLERAVQLLKGMDEFAQSRFRLEARYRHVLVDEFQDTSRAQWELVAQLVRSWGEGLGASADAIPPSIFIVGDRKQSIYGFRDADVGVLDEAVGIRRALRPEGDPRRAISVSFRSASPLLAFVNDVFGAIVGHGLSRRDAFLYRDSDRFPVRRRREPTTLPPWPRRTTSGGQCRHRRVGLAVRDRRRLDSLPVRASATRRIGVADEVVRILSGLDDSRPGARHAASGASG